MKKSNFISMSLLGAIILLFSCSKNEIQRESASIVSPEVIAKFKAKGFNTEGIKKTGDGRYLIEYCTEVSEEQLNGMIDPIGVNNALGEEQYRTYNLVSSPRAIKISGPTSPAKINTGINQAIAKYNSLGLNITFTRVTSGADITVKYVSGSAGGVSGFPSGGNPYKSVTVYTGTTSYSQGVVTHVITHEIGHTIGFRHSDYFNRSLSCGTGGNEGASSVGAVLIPGTTSGFDSGSVMNSCFSSSSTGNFSLNDVAALYQLY